MEDAMTSEREKEFQQRSPEQSQSMKDNQQGFPEQTYSISALMESSRLALENECLELEKKIEIKTKSISGLKENCARQEVNIARQQLDLEHLKVKTLSHFTNQKAVLEKNDFIRGKFETLQKTFSTWAKGINTMLSCKEELQQVAQQRSKETKQRQDYCDQLEQEYKRRIDHAKKILHDLSTLKEREENYFDQAIEHLKSEQSIQDHRSKELEEQMQGLIRDCREQAILINFLTPQNEQLRETLTNLKTELAADMKRVTSNTEQLETSLQMELKKKEALTERLEETEKETFKTSSLLCEKETEIKNMDRKLKDLLDEGEELEKVYKTEIEAVSNLRATAETMKEELGELVQISEKNNILNQQHENLEKINEENKTKIAELLHAEECHLQKLKDLDEFIEKMETERKNVINERLTIEDQINELQREMNENTSKNQTERIEMDKSFVNLKEENEKFNKSLDALSEQMAEASDNKKELEKVISALKIEVERARAISQEKDYEFSSFTEECKMIEKDQQSKLSMLDDMIASAKQDYSTAQSDVVMCGEIKNDLKRREKELETTKEKNLKYLEELQESQNKLIEVKRQQMEDARLKSERELETEGHCKMDAFVELREIKAEIEELEKQKSLTKTELQKARSNVMKCDNLIRKMESKLSEVAHIAAGNSQSIASASGQSSKILNLPPPPRRISGLTPSSPASDSSGLTFNPDDVDLIKLRRKRFGLNQNYPVTKSLTTKEKSRKTKETNKKGTEKKKEKELSPEKDDWGF